MANRFGIFYDDKTGKAYTDNTFQTEYIPKTHRNPKTPVHAKMFKQDREKAAAKRKKDYDKQKKEAMKKFVEGGCGHANIMDFIEPNSAIEDWRNCNALLTDEKEQYPYTQKSIDGDYLLMRRSSTLIPRRVLMVMTTTTKTLRKVLILKGCKHCPRLQVQAFVLIVKIILIT